MIKFRYGILAILFAIILSSCAGQTDQPAMETPALPDAVEAAEARLSEELDVSVAEIEVISFEEVEWPDACLGYAEPGELCAQVLTPGWQIVLSVNGIQYEFHTDQTGDVMRWQRQ